MADRELRLTLTAFDEMVADARADERRKVSAGLTGSRAMQAFEAVYFREHPQDAVRPFDEAIAAAVNASSLLVPEGEDGRCTCVRTDAGVMPVGVSPGCPVHVPSPSSEPARDGDEEVEVWTERRGEGAVDWSCASITAAAPLGITRRPSSAPRTTSTTEQSPPTRKEAPMAELSNATLVMGVVRRECRLGDPVATGTVKDQLTGVVTYDAVDKALRWLWLNGVLSKPRRGYYLPTKGDA